jgi:hypothetical protein
VCIVYSDVSCNILPPFSVQFQYVLSKHSKRTYAAETQKKKNNKLTLELLGEGPEVMHGNQSSKKYGVYQDKNVK